MKKKQKHISIVYTPDDKPTAYSDRGMAEAAFIAAVNKWHKANTRFFSDALVLAARNLGMVRISDVPFFETSEASLTLKGRPGRNRAVKALLVSDPLSMLKSRGARPAWGRAKFSTVIKEHTSHGRGMYPLNGMGLVAFSVVSQARVTSDGQETIVDLVPGSRASMSVTETVASASGFVMMMDGSEFYDWEPMETAATRYEGAPDDVDSLMEWPAPWKHLVDKDGNTVGLVVGDGKSKSYDVELQMNDTIGMPVRIIIRKTPPKETKR